MKRDVPVPEDGLCLEDGLLEESVGLRTGIETHPVVGDALRVCGETGLCMRSLLTAHAAQKRRTHGRVLVELVSSNEVDREDNLDVPLLGLLHEGTNLLGASLVEKRVTDLWEKRGHEVGHFMAEIYLTETFSRTFLKVKAIPPQIMSEST